MPFGFRSMSSMQSLLSGNSMKVHWIFSRSYSSCHQSSRAKPGQVKTGQVKTEQGDRINRKAVAAEHDCSTELTSSCVSTTSSLLHSRPSLPINHPISLQ